jgi:hypothetical protein
MGIHAGLQTTRTSLTPRVVDVRSASMASTSQGASLRIGGTVDICVLLLLDAADMIDAAAGELKMEILCVDAL